MSTDSDSFNVALSALPASLHDAVIAQDMPSVRESARSLHFLFAQYSWAPSACPHFASRPFHSAYMDQRVDSRVILVTA